MVQILMSRYLGQRAPPYIFVAGIGFDPSDSEITIGLAAPLEKVQTMSCVVSCNNEYGRFEKIGEGTLIFVPVPFQRGFGLGQAVIEAPQVTECIDLIYKFDLEK